MTNYIITHKDNCELSYNYDNKYVIYNVNEYHDLQNIDMLNRMFCEYCGMYYVWKNNIKDDVVVFSHYRRQINPKHIHIDKILNNNSFQVFYKYLYTSNYNNRYQELYHIIKALNIPEFIYEDLCEYLDSQNIINHQKLNELCNSQNIIFYHRCIFATTWDNFCELNEFIYGYIEFIQEKYNIHTYEDWVNYFNKFIIPHYIKSDITKLNNFSRCFQSIKQFSTVYNDDHGIQTNNIWRIYAYIIEHLISIYIRSTNFFYDYLYENWKV